MSSSSLPPGSLPQSPQGPPPKGPQPKSLDVNVGGVDPQSEALLTQDPQPLGQNPQGAEKTIEGMFAEAMGASDPVSSEDSGPSMQQLTDHVFGSMVDKENEKAHGFGEKLYWHSASLAKSIADGFAHATNFTARHLADNLTTRTLVQGPDGEFTLTSGQDQLLQEMEEAGLGTDPDSVDYMHYVQRRLGRLTDEGPIRSGDVADELIQKRLGANAIYSQTAGFMLAFAKAPGAQNLARAGAETAQAASRVLPLAKVAERWLAKKALKNSGEAAKILESGKVWEAMASSPKWQESATLMQKMYAMGGRNINDVISTTGANALQSYAMTADEERTHHLIAASAMSPFMVPIARVGQRISEMIVTKSISPQAAERLTLAFNKFSRGEMGAKELDKIARQSSPLAARGLATAVTSAFEGTAFTGLTPEGRDLMGKWLGGDADAGAQLLRMTMATAGGVAAIKFAIPTDLTPMFRQVRPDINTLRIHMEAEANRRAGLDKEIKEGVQDPQKAEREAGLEEHLGGKIPKPQIGDPAERFVKLVEQSHGKMEEQYGWAEPETIAAMRSHWDPTFVELQGPTTKPGKMLSGDVKLRFGEHEVTLSKSAEGMPSLQVPENVRAALKSVGKDADAVMHGDAARATLDDLALMGIMMKNMGSMTYQRAGMEEVAPNKWAHKGADEYYSMDLDGTSRVTGPLDNSLIRTETHIEVGGHGMNQLWDSPIATKLSDAIQAKRSISPDELVDGILFNAIATARYVEGPTADKVRQFLDSVDPQALMNRLNEVGDRLLALDLGSLATGTHNAEALIMEIAKGEQARQADLKAKAAEAEADAALKPGEELVEAMQKDPGGKAEGPEIPGAVREANRTQAKDADRAAYLEAMAEAARAATEPATKPSTEPAVENAVAPPEARSTGVVKMSENQMDALSRFIPKKSPLGKQIAKLGGERGEVTVTLKEIATLAEKWAKWSQSEVQKTGDQRPAQSADAWLSSALDSLGVNHPKTADPSRSQRYVSLSERVANRIGPVKPAKSAVVREQMAEAAKAKSQSKPPGPSEAHGGIPVKEVVKDLKKIGVASKRALDVIVRDMADALKGEGVRHGERVLRAVTRSGRIEGRAMEHLERMEKLATSRKTKAEFKELVRDEVSVGGKEHMTRSHFSALVDGLVKPKTPLQTEIVEVGQAFHGSLRDAASDAGGFRQKKTESGEDFYEPIRKGGPSVSQHVQGADLHKVMDSPPLREAFLKDLAESNKLWTKGEDGKKRRVTGEDLHKEWEAAQESSRNGTTASDKQAATEFSRRFHEYPEKWSHGDKTYEIQDVNPHTKMRRIAQVQSGRAAAIEEFGVAAGDAASRAKLRAIGKQEGWDKRFMDALEKGGVENAITNELRPMREQGNPKARNERDVLRMERQMELISARLQGTELVEGMLQKTSPELSLAWRGFQALRASAMSSLAFIKDIPDMARGVQFTGLRRSAKAVAALAQSSKEFVTMLRRDGVLQHVTGDHIFQEAKGWLGKIADVIAKPGTLSERVKTVFNAKQMELMINDMNAGKGTEMDYYFTETVLRLGDLRGKKIDGDLKVHAIRQGVEFLSSRARKGSYSKFADDPRVGALMVFQRFATKRMESHVRVVEGVLSTAKEHGWGSKQNMASWNVAGRTVAGISLIGVLGDFLYQGLIGAAVEGDLDGFRQFYNETTASGQAFAEAWLSGVENQAVGGPLATTSRLLSHPGEVKTWTDTTSPGALAHAIVKATVALGEGDSMFAVHAFEDAGVVPIRPLVTGWARAGILGQDPDLRRASRQVWDWRRENDLMPAGGGDRAREDAFYEAVDKSMNALQNNGLDIDAALKEASGHITEALGLAPSESVAASIRGRRLIRNLDALEREKLFESINDEETINKLIQYDEALTDMAGKIRQMEGTRDGDFETMMKAVAQQATRGTRDQWVEVRNMAVEDAALDMEAGVKSGPSIQEFARHFAMYPDHFDTVFEGPKLRALQRKKNSAARANLIWRFLMRSAKERLVRQQRDERKDQR